jgi:hypothetical protein
VARRLLIFGLMLIALVASSPAAALAGSRVVRLGSGADEVWLFWPQGPPRSVVVFGHGWSTPFPSAFMPWIEHLRAGGNLVIYPRYELTSADSEASALAALRQGIVTAFARIGRLRVPVIALGKSFSGGAIFDYAAEAPAWKVPAPSAVLSVFPAIPIGGLPPTPLPPGMDVEVLVGDRDTVVGSSGASVIWRWLAVHPAAEKRYVLVRSHAGFVADHASPALADAGARAAFWRPLDLLIARARRAPPAG